MTNPAQMYEAFLVPAVFRPWAEELVRRLEPREGIRALDAGCGTGVVTRLVAQAIGPKGAVTGLDMNPAMLEIARGIPVEAGSAPITWVQSAADSVALPDATFDLITCQQMLQFAPDRLAVLREFRRLLAPGGRVAIAAWAGAELHPLQMEVDRAIQRRTGQPALAAGFALSESEEIRTLLEAAGFRVDGIELVHKESRFRDPEGAIRNHLLAATAGIASFRQLDSEARDEVLRQIASDVAPLVREHTVDGELVHDWHAHIALATVPLP
jgi:ubiquinone/menaquinone biosynthesis C-methylase UbiE